MQALLENEVVSLYTQDKVLSEFDSLMEMVKTADAVLKNKIETNIVEKGTKFIPELIEHIQNNKGTTRGVCAMCLIRIGKVCESFIKEAAKQNKDFAWTANYILNEL